MTLMKRALLAIIGEKGRSFLLLVSLVLTFSLLMSSLIISYGTKELSKKITSNLDNYFILDSNDNRLNILTAEEKNILYDLVLYNAEKVINSDFCIQYSLLTKSVSMATDLEHPRIDWYIYENQLQPSGIANVDDLIFKDNINIISGRSFTQEEINDGDKVILIHRDYERQNKERVKVGDILTLYGDVIGFRESSLENGEPIERIKQEFEIIGTFDFVEKSNSPIAYYDYYSYIPYTTLKNIKDEIRKLSIDHEVEYSEINNANAIDTFVIKTTDPNKFEETKNTIDEEILRYYDIFTVDEEYRQLKGPIDNMSNLADYTAIFGGTAAMILSSLMIYLFISGQRKHSAVVLAMGEKKLKTVLVIVLEVTMITIVSDFVASVVSYCVGSSILEDISSGYSYIYNFDLSLLISIFVLIASTLMSSIISFVILSKKTRDMLL